MALEDADFGAKFAYLFASQHIQALNENFHNREEPNVIRSNILNMLQDNFKGKANWHSTQLIACRDEVNS